MTAIQTSMVAIFREVSDQLEVLLVKNTAGSDPSKHKFSLPGGTLEDGEDFEAAARRELLEETGLLAIELVELETVYSATMEKDGVQQLYKGKAFLCRSHRGSLLSSFDTVPEWVVYERINNYPLRPNTIEAIQEARAYINKTLAQ